MEKLFLVVFLIIGILAISLFLSNLQFEENLDR